MKITEFRHRWQSHEDHATKTACRRIKEV